MFINKKFYKKHTSTNRHIRTPDHTNTQLQSFSKTRTLSLQVVHNDPCKGGAGHWSSLFRFKHLASGYYLAAEVCVCVYVYFGLYVFFMWGSFHVIHYISQVDSDTNSDVIRNKLRGLFTSYEHTNKKHTNLNTHTPTGGPQNHVFCLISVPNVNDVATVFELDPTTMTTESTVPRFVSLFCCCRCFVFFVAYLIKFFYFLLIIFIVVIILLLLFLLLL